MYFLIWNHNLHIENGYNSWTKEINCGTPGILPNGYLEGGRSTLGAQVTFKCHKDMLHEGTDKTTCQVNTFFSIDSE